MTDLKRVQRKMPTRRDQELAEAIDAGSRERAAVLYGLWTSQYSNEDSDRVSGLADRLTDIDRQEGRVAPPVGFSRLRLAQAKQVVTDANNYGAFQQGLSAQRHAARTASKRHATKKKSPAQLQREIAEALSRADKEAPTETLGYAVYWDRGRVHHEGDRKTLAQARRFAVSLKRNGGSPLIVAYKRSGDRTWNEVVNEWEDQPRAATFVPRSKR